MDSSVGRFHKQHWWKQNLSLEEEHLSSSKNVTVLAGWEGQNNREHKELLFLTSVQGKEGGSTGTAAAGHVCQARSAFFCHTNVHNHPHMPGMGSEIVYKRPIWVLKHTHFISWPTKWPAIQPYWLTLTWPAFTTTPFIPNPTDVWRCWSITLLPLHPYKIYAVVGKNWVSALWV